MKQVRFRIGTWNITHIYTFSCKKISCIPLKFYIIRIIIEIFFPAAYVSNDVINYELKIFLENQSSSLEESSEARNAPPVFALSKLRSGNKLFHGCCPKLRRDEAALKRQGQLRNNNLMGGAESENTGNLLFPCTSVL